MQKLIGLSLSRCCKDMAEGKVDLKSVKLIISSTSIRNPKAMERVIKEYRSCMWSKEVGRKAGIIFRQMFAEGKVEQPRLTRNGRCPDLWGPNPLGLGSHWITNRKAIKWDWFPASPED